MRTVQASQRAHRGTLLGSLHRVEVFLSDDVSPLAAVDATAEPQRAVLSASGFGQRRFNDGNIWRSPRRRMLEGGVLEDLSTHSTLRDALVQRLLFDAGAIDIAGVVEGTLVHLHHHQQQSMLAGEELAETPR